MNTETTIEPISGGTQCYEGLTNKNHTFILAYVDLPAGANVSFEDPVLKSNEGVYYYEVKFNYAGEKLSNTTVSYMMPPIKYKGKESDFPGYIEFCNSSGGTKIKVKTSQPTGQGEQTVAVNDFKIHVLSNTPEQPEGVELSPTYYLVFTEIANSGGKKVLLKSAPDLMTNTLFYSFENAASEAEASNSSYAWISDNLLVFTEITLMEGNTKVKTQAIGGEPVIVPFADNGIM